MATITAAEQDATRQPASQSPAREASSHVFAGWRIWIAQRVPQRSLYLSKVIEHGGQVVPLERQADIMIADHLRRDVIPDTYSYKWIEACIAADDIVPKENHRAGPSSENLGARPVGSMVRPAKTGRNPFTAEDDKVLYQWVTEHARKGGSALGNEIYKQLEVQNNRHPWQSWRDRYVKYLSKRPPPPTLVTQETPPTPPPDDNAAARARQQESRPELQSQKQIQQPASTPALAAVDEPEIPSRPMRSQASIITQEQASTAIPTSTQPLTNSIPPKQSPRKRIANSDASTSRTQSQNEDTAAPAQVPSSPWVAPYTPMQGQMVPSPQQPGQLFKRPFSIDEHQLLVDNVANIQASVVERYGTMWSDPRIFDLSRHTPEEWKLYYETKVLPDWKKLPNQVKQKRLSDVYERTDYDETTELLHNVQHVYSANPTPEKPRHSSQSLGLSQAGKSSSEAQKRARQVIEIDDDGSDSPSSSKRQRQNPTLPPASGEDTLEGDEPQVPSQSQTLPGIGNIVEAGSRESSQQQPDFNVFEDRELPEDEKENVILDNEGAYSLPPRHVHVRSSEALEAFSDPLPTFTLLPRIPDADDELETPVTANAEDDEPLEETEQDAIPDDQSAPGHNDEDELDDSLVVTPPRPQDQDTEVSDFADVSPGFDADDDDDPENEEERVTFETIQPSQLIRRESTTQTAGDDDGMVEQEDVDSSDENNEDAFDVDSLLNFNQRVEQAAVEASMSTGHRRSRRSINPTATEQAPTPPSLFVSSPHSQPRIHPTVSHITVRQELHDNPYADLSPLDLASQTDPQDNTPPQPNNVPRQQAQDTQSTSTLLEDLIASETASGQHSARDVLYALQRGNLDPSVVPAILGYLARGESLPRDVKGIWTEVDDEALKSGDARAIRRLEGVHGREALGLRLAVLNSWEDL